MLDEFRKAAVNHAMKIMSHPAVTKFMSDPRVMKALGKGFELHNQIRTRVEDVVRSVGEMLHPTSKKSD